MNAKGPCLAHCYNKNMAYIMLAMVLSIIIGVIIGVNLHKVLPTSTKENNKLFYSGME